MYINSNVSPACDRSSRYGDLVLYGQVNFLATYSFTWHGLLGNR